MARNFGKSHVDEIYTVGGFIVSTHAAALTISKLFFGVAADKTSNLKLLTGGVIVCSTASICLAFSSSISQITLIMLMIGCMQGSWVPATKLVAMWFDDSSYATMFSILGCASTMAGLLLPVLKDYYWRTIELNCALFMLVFTILCKFLIREDVVERLAKKSEKNGDGIGLKHIAKSSVVWHIALVYLFSMEMRTICETWVPLYLTEKNGPSDGFQVLYELGGLIGIIASGLIVDQLAVRFGVDKSRRGVGIVCSILMMIFAIGVFRFEEHASWLGFLTGFFVNGSINIWCLIGSQAGTNSIAGTSAAFISFIATSGSIFAGSPLASLIANYGYGVFTTLFITQIVFVITISSMNVPLRMGNHMKKEN